MFTPRHMFISVFYLFITRLQLSALHSVFVCSSLPSKSHLFKPVEKSLTAILRFLAPGCNRFTSGQILIWNVLLYVNLSTDSTDWIFLKLILLSSHLDLPVHTWCAQPEYFLYFRPISGWNLMACSHLHFLALYTPIYSNLFYAPVIIFPVLIIVLWCLNLLIHHLFTTHLCVSPHLLQLSGSADGVHEE